MSDIIQFDRYNVGDIFENVDVDFDSRENVLALNFHVNRFFSQDASTVNNYGYGLIEVCKSNGLLIANGRCGLDSLLVNVHVLVTAC